MTLGQKIKKLRTEQGLTQKDLADQVHVTFQTVSKWEKDENEPDVSTLRELAKLFNCSMDYLLSEEENETPKEEASAEPEPAAPVAEPVTKTIIIHQKEMHVCQRCKKDIPENELEIDQVCVRHAGRGRSAEYRDVYYHKNCLEQQRKEDKEREEKQKALKANSDRKKCFGWSIAAGVIALGIALVVFLGVESLKAVVHPALAVLYSVLIGYGMFAMLYCIISGSYIGDVFIWAAGLSIKFPGLIFSWDIDGIIWVITMKVIFAILAFLIGIATFIFAVALSAALSVVSFPFILIHNNNTNYEDTL